MTLEVLQQALEKVAEALPAYIDGVAAREYLTVIHKALAEPPAQRAFVGLTDKEAFQICVDCGCLSEDWLTFLDAIEAKLRSKNEKAPPACDQ